MSASMRSRRRTRSAAVAVIGRSLLRFRKSPWDHYVTILTSHSRLRSCSTTCGSAESPVITRSTRSIGHRCASSVRPIFEPSASTTTRCAALSIRFLTSASGRLTLVTPPAGSTPLQPRKSVCTLICSRISVAIGSTSEGCHGRSVPPRITTDTRGSATSSSSAVFRPFVNTTTLRRSSRCASARAAAAVVVPTSISSVSASRTRAAAARPIATFSSAMLVSDSSNGRSLSGSVRGIAPPRMRCTSPRKASASRSLRTVTSEMPKRSLSSPTRTKSRSRIAASIRSRRNVALTGDSSVPAIVRQAYAVAPMTRREIRSWLMDMDGVLVHEEQAIPGADHFIARLRETGTPFLVLTNNSIYTPRDLSARLAASGLDVPESSIWTSALATARFLEDQRPGGSAFVIGEARLADQLPNAGYTLTERSPDYVVLGETRTYSFERITRAIRLIAAGARFIATNPDTTGPSVEGPLPATGSVAALISRATGVDPYFVGKPNPLMMRSALNAIGAHSETTAMIGDRMDTDIVSGLEAGLHTILVLTGVTTAEQTERFPYRPSEIVESVAELADELV